MGVIPRPPTPQARFRIQMGRRRDEQRFERMKRLNPDYKGFRGYDREPTRPGNTPLVAVTCSACSRKRNVPVGIAQAQGDAYVCVRCTEERALAP